MKTALIRKWAHAPWHSWIKEHPEWVNLFAELWARLPEPAVKQLLCAPCELVVLPPVNYSRVVRLATPLLSGAYILQLDMRLTERPRAEAVAILAHEVAHLCTTISEDELDNDLRADQLVVSWGFHKELLGALNADLEASHPRVKALCAA